MGDLSLAFGEALEQVPLLGERFGFVTNHRHDTCYRALRAIQQSDRKCNRQRSPVFMHGGNPQHVMSVAGLPARHCSFVAGPVTLPQTLGNNEIERAAKGLSLSESEEALGGGVPYRDGTARISDNNRVAQRLDKVLEINGCLRSAIHHLLARAGV